MNFRLFITACCIAAFASSAHASDTYPKQELRAAWMAALGIDWPNAQGTSSSTVQSQKDYCTAYLDRMKAAGFNAVFFHVRPMADRMYLINSYTHNGHTYTVYEPFSHYVSGSRGTETSYDPLAFWIEECHKRGMELHAWVNPYRFTTITPTGSPASASDWKAGPVNTSLDQNTYNAGMIILGTQGSGTSYTNKWVFNPALEATNSRITSVCRVLTGAYDIDGIVFDDYFYPEGLATNSSAPDYPQYQTYINRGGTLSIQDWRRSNINHMVDLVNQAIKEIKPWVRFGIAPAGAAYYGLKSSDNTSGLDLPNRTWSDWQYADIYSDPMAWLREKTIDYISPQLYWKTTHSTNPFGPMSKWWSIIANHFGRHFFASHSMSYLASSYTDSDRQEAAKQVALTRTNSVDNCPGQVFYSAKNSVSASRTELLDLLHTTHYQYLATPPAMTWFNAPDPGLITNLARNSSGTKLTWDPVSTSNCTADQMRYVVYIVPRSVYPDNALSADHPGLKAEYIAKIQYGSTSFDIPSSQRSLSNWWYAVAPLDRYGNEWEATTINAPARNPVPVTLTSPANGARVTDIQSFAWTGVDNAIYTLEISNSSTFNNVLISESTQDTNITLDISELNDNATFYWRVKAQAYGYLDGTSAVRSFVTPVIPDVTTPILVAPHANQVCDLYQTFEWLPANADDCVLQISSSQDFTLCEIEEHLNVGNLSSVTVNLATLIPNHAYFWRVVSNRVGYHPATSEVRRFYTPPVPTAPRPNLYAPDDQAEVDFDVVFVIDNTDAEKTYLQVSTTANFSNIIYTGSESWLEFNGCLQYTIPLDYFYTGTFYWRIRTTKPDHNDGYSEVRSFSVNVGGSSSYTPGHDRNEYDLIPSTSSNNSITLTNAWFRNVGTNSILDFDSSAGALTRDMVARPAGNDQAEDIIYLTTRTDNTTGAKLIRVKASTGERLPDLNLTFDANWSSSYFVINSIFLDASGNLCVSNATVSAANTLTIGKVNVQTGAVTTMFSTVPGVRIDHPNIYGTLSNTGTYYVFGPSGGGTCVKRWTVTNGAITATQSTTVSPGVAPRVAPVDEQYFFLDGQSIAPTLYLFRNNQNANKQSTLPESASPLTHSTCGFASFWHDDQHFAVYPYDGGNEAVNGFQWIVSTAPDFTNSMANASRCWTIPQNDPIGTTYPTSGDYGAPVSIIQRKKSLQSVRARVPGTADDVTNIYLYAPGNGLAAYTMTSLTLTGAENVAADAISDTQRTFTLQGVEVTDTENLTPGVYIRVVGNSASKILIK